MESEFSTFCDYFNRGECRSCSELAHPYAEQVTSKELQVELALGLRPLPTAKSAAQGFRNRAKMSVTGTVEYPLIGLVGDLPSREGGLSSLDKGRELLACPIHHPELNEIFQALPEFIREYRLIPYQIAERSGELKGLIAFHSPVRAETYLRFILRSQECVSRLRKMLPKLQARFPKLVCVSANIQPIPHAVLEGKEEIFLTERTWITHELGGVPLRLSPNAFVQTNAAVAEELYLTAALWMKDLGVESGVELFCGQGAFSFLVAPYVNRFLGVEVNPEAVRSANETAQSLGLSQLSFLCLDAAREGEAIEAAVSAASPDLILVNPPRRGIGHGVALLEKLRPAHVIYSSCSLASLTSDLEKLPSYRIEKIQIFDMFPHTSHFETLVLLSPKS